MKGNAIIELAVAWVFFADTLISFSGTFFWSSRVEMPKKNKAGIAMPIISTWNENKMRVKISKLCVAVLLIAFFIVLIFYGLC